MFIVNFKINIKRFIYIAILLISLMIVLFVIGKNNISISSISKNSSTNYIVTSDNFIATLKQIYDNVDDNVGKSVKTSGFAFKLDDFKDNQIVIGRNYILDSSDKVVGFMCNIVDTKEKIEEDKWYEIEGVIEKDIYKDTSVPVIKILNIKSIDTPKNTYVQDN